MLKFTSVSGSVRAFTDIILTVIIIRTGITRDLIIVPITARTIDTAGVVIIAIIIPTITGTSLIGIATPGWLEAISSQPKFPVGTRRGKFDRRKPELCLPYLGEPAGLVTGLLPGPSSWNSFLNC
jgi:hypothetical protein